MAICKSERKQSVIGSTVTSSPKPYLGKQKSGYIPGLPRVGMVTPERERRLSKIRRATGILTIAVAGVNATLYPMAFADGPKKLRYLVNLAKRAP